jgi:gamma-glutamylcyclotransferase
MLYFAYGSNLNSGQMKRRCPDAKLIQVASAKEFELIFPRLRHPHGGGGAASLSPAKDQKVYGALYELHLDDLQSLDTFEGYQELRTGNEYIRTDFEVFDLNGGLIKCQTYLAIPEGGPFVPAEDYLQLILSGLQELEAAGVPRSYIDFVKSLDRLNPLSFPN